MLIPVKEKTIENQSVATFNDGVGGTPISVKLPLLPVQDLHGYDYPWVGGGGKNLFPEQNVSGTLVSSFSFALPAGTYVVSALPTSSDTDDTQCAVNILHNNTSLAIGYLNRGTRNSVTLTTSSESNKINFYAAKTYAKSTGDTFSFMDVMICLSTATDPTVFKPYANICPITGHEGANVVRTGKNLCGGELLRDGILYEGSSNATDHPTERYISFTGSSTKGVTFVPKKIFKENTVYTIIFTYSNSASSPRSNMTVMYSDGTTGNLPNPSQQNTKYTCSVQTITGKTVVGIRIMNSSGYTSLYYDESGIFEGVLTAQDFEAYTGNTYPITFPTPPGTVYGGELSILQDGTGTLTVETVFQEFDGTEGTDIIHSIIYTGSVVRFNTSKVFGGSILNNTKNATIRNKNNVKSNLFFRGSAGAWASAVVGGFGVITGTPWFMMPENTFSDAQSVMTWLAGLKTAGTPLQMCLELKDPVTYTLTAEQVGQILALNGINNVWSDTGNISELKYTADNSAGYEDAVKNDAPSHIRMTFEEQNIVFEDADFVQGGVNITDILNGDTDLTIGSAVMKQVSAEMYVSTKTRQLVWDKEFKLEIGIDVGAETKWVTIGYFSGERPEKLNSEGVILFTANDRMGKFDILADDWMNSIDYTTPKTVQNLYDSLCTFAGVENVAGDELAGIMSRSYSASPFASGGILCRDVLALIAEAAGCYAKVTNEGKVKLVWFADHTDYELTGDDEFKIDSLGINFSDGSMTWEEMESYTWEDLEQMRWSDIEYYQKQLAINALNVVQTVDDVGILVPTGATTTPYMIVDNPFLTTASDADVTAYIEPIYNRLHALGGYLPLSMECIGNPCVEAGDIITVEVKGESVALPIFYKTMTCNGTCTDSYEATGNVKREEVPMNQREKLSTGGRYHVWKNTVEELYSELYDPTTGDVSVLKQTAQALGMSASGIDITGGKYVKIESGGTFDVDAINFKISSADKKMTAGNWIYGDTGIAYEHNATGSFYIYPDINDLSDFPFEVGHGLTILNPSTDNFRIYAGYNRGVDPSVDNVLAEFNLTKYRGETISTLELGTKNKETGLSTNGGRIKNLHEIWNGSSQDLKVISLSLSLYEQYNSSDPNVIISSSGDIFLDHAGTSTISLWGQTGDIYCNNVYQSSSREVKHDIKKLPSSSEIIDKLEPVSFVYNNDEEKNKRFGLIYEDTIDVLPEICHETEGKKGIDYTALIPVLLKEIQDLRKRVAELERRVK